MKPPSSAAALLLAFLGVVYSASFPAFAASPAPSPKPPHIVFFLADDLGWKDVGYHGSEIKTPTIDRMAAAGARLEQFYVMPVCTPTRTCLMTGRHPIRTGLQTGVIRPWSTYGIPLDERLLPQVLKEAGYVTAITGKWHLGHASPEYLPTRRGFDHQYGFYVGQIGYFTKVQMGAYDWHRNDQTLREEGYTTTLIGNEAVKLIEQHDAAKPLFLYVAFNAPHVPLEAPEEYLARYAHIADKDRRTFAAMVSCLDDTMARVLAALDKRGMTRDTLVIFSSDNGGPTKLGANNDPLREAKATLYEGGVRVPAWAVWPGRIKPGTVVNEPLHMVDWYPTLLKLAGASAKQAKPLDGRDLWPTLTQGKPSPHDELLVNVEPNKGAVRRGNWKLVVHGKLPRGEAVGKAAPKIELFNLAIDPSEKTNLADKEPNKVEELFARLDVYAREAVKPNGGDARPADFKTPAVWGVKD
jgi:arylsulfatase A-like enzyme